MLFFNYINSKHQNIKFTMERESDKKISFLDLIVSKNQTENMTKLNLSIFRKKTFTGVGMVFTAVHTSNSRSTISKHLFIGLAHYALLGPLLIQKLDFYLVILVRIHIHLICFIIY